MRSSRPPGADLSWGGGSRCTQAAFRLRQESGNGTQTKLRLSHAANCMVRQVRANTPALASHTCALSSVCCTGSSEGRAGALTVAARVVGDAGGPQLREASLTSAAVPAGALAAQAVFVTSVGRHQLLLRFGEKALLCGAPHPRTAQRILPSPQHWFQGRNALMCFECLARRSCSSSLLPWEGKSCPSRWVGALPGGEAGPCSLRLSVDTSPLPT